MMKPVYILSASAISPQHTFDPQEFLQPEMGSDNGKLYVVDAPYSKYISPVAIRRMSKIIKMGISTAMDSLQQANVTCPDAVLTGTGMGSMVDMEHFLKDMIRLKEEALNPTYFIQSTYNSVNGWIALQTKCNGYNQTFVHRGLSLELALLDAQLYLSESDEKKTALAGCFDEMTDEYFLIKNKIGYWKNEPPASALLLAHSDTEGTIGGEGAAFFTLSNKKDNGICSIQGIKTFQDPEDNDIENGIKELLEQFNLTPDDIGLLLCGMNGDSRQQHIYTNLLQLFPGVTVAAFKHLCGEYATSSGFALWLATYIFRRQTIPSQVIYHQGKHSFDNILIVNHYVTGSVSIVLLERN